MTVHTVISALPPGWRVIVDLQSDGVWLKVFGPERQGAAFNVPHDSIRGNVLTQFKCAIDAMTDEPSVCPDCHGKGAKAANGVEFCNCEERV